MIRLTDIVSYSEAVRLRDCGFDAETSDMYKLDINLKNPVIGHQLTTRDWNHLCHRTISAPTYAEVLDWLMDNGYDWTQGFYQALKQLSTIK